MLSAIGVNSVGDDIFCRDRKYTDFVSSFSSLLSIRQPKTTARGGALKRTARRNRQRTFPLAWDLGFWAGMTNCISHGCIPTVVQLIPPNRSRSSNFRFAKHAAMPAPSLSSHVLAHSARASGQSVRLLTSSLNGISSRIPPLDAGAYAGANASDVSGLFRSLETALSSPFASARTAALRASVSALRGLPPHLSAPHVLPLARQLVSLHRSRASDPDARFLFAMAGCAAAAAGMRGCGKDAEAVCVALANTLLAHVAAVVNAIAPVEADAPAVGALMCTALACVAAAPSAARARIPLLMGLAADAAFQSPRARVRSSAVALAARLLAARSSKARPHEAGALVSSTVGNIAEIVSVLSSFTGRDTSTSEVSPLVQKLNARALLARFQSLCSLLTSLFDQPFAHCVEVPVSRAVSALTSAIRLAGVDPMATSGALPLLTPESVLAILPGIHEAALSALPAFLHTVQPGAVLPCFSTAADAVSACLLNNAAASASITPELVQIRVRSALYATVGKLTTIVGAPAVHNLARPFSVAFGVDMDLYVKLRTARRSAWTSGRTDDSGMSGEGKSRKRRRKQGGRGGTGAASQSLVASLSDHKNAPGEDTVRMFETAIHAGLEACEAMFRAGAIAEPTVANALRSLEGCVADAMAVRETRTKSLAALAAAIQGAGSNGGTPHATPLFESAVVAVPRMEHVGFDPCTDAEAVGNAKSAFEALLHPRAAPPLSVRSMAASRPVRSVAVPAVSSGLEKRSFQSGFASLAEPNGSSSTPTSFPPMYTEKETAPAPESMIVDDRPVRSDSDVGAEKSNGVGNSSSAVAETADEMTNKNALADIANGKRVRFKNVPSELPAHVREMETGDTLAAAEPRLEDEVRKPATSIVGKRRAEELVGGNEIAVASTKQHAQQGSDDDIVVGDEDEILKSLCLEPSDEE